MPFDRVNFAVVREDPAVEEELARERKCRSALLIASGGCTALHLLSRRPELRLTLLDPNPAQLELIRAKTEALRRPGYRRVFNVGDPDPAGLTQCGVFEDMFRELRRDLGAVCPEAEWERRLAAGDFGDGVLEHPAWRGAFRAGFADEVLARRFGPDAIQHAAPQSYAGYFADRLAAGLNAPGSGRNYFLHHILLGRYLEAPEAQPAYLSAPPREFDWSIRRGFVEDVEDWDRFDLIGLSNIFDWMDPDASRAAARRVAAGAAPGATLVLRQLNNARDLSGLFSPEFEFDEALGRRLLASERSLFYERILVGRRKP